MTMGGLKDTADLPVGEQADDAAALERREAKVQCWARPTTDELRAMLDEIDGAADAEARLVACPDQDKDPTMGGGQLQQADVAAGDDMSNRQQRRASLTAFRREAAGGYLDVCLTPADDVSLTPLLRNAVQFWLANVAVRKPTCISCKRKFSTDLRPGAFVLTVPERAPTSCGTSALCAACWSGLSDAEVEKAALRVVRKVLRGAVFDPVDTR